MQKRFSYHAYNIFLIQKKIHFKFETNSNYDGISLIKKINFGKEIGIKKTSAQVTNYTKESLLGRKCIAIINLGDRQIGPIMSQCLVLGSISKDRTVELLSPEINASVGDKIA